MSDFLPMKLKKTVCKSKPHDWVNVYRSTHLWPYEVKIGRQCVRCGRKKKD